MKLPFVISLPHAAGKIPGRIRSRIHLNNDETQEAVDLGTREIFGDLPALEVICAEWNRLVVDLNRPPDVRHAKGPVALVDYHGRSIYKPHDVPDDAEITRRIIIYYEPYHRRLRNALSMESVKGLLDCHSLQGIGPAEAPDAGKRRKDITLGNNGGPDGEKDSLRGELSCNPDQLLVIKKIFEEAGFSVALNIPYAGGFILAHYGPMIASKGKIALQIEINQDLYVDPGTETIISKKMGRVKGRIAKCIQEIGQTI